MGSNKDQYLHADFDFSDETSFKNVPTVVSNEESLQEAINNVEAPADTLQQYLRQISGYKLLTAAEEIHYAKLVEQGDSTAKDILVKHNLRLVVSIAKHYKYSELPILDLIQEGSIGLMTATDKFDYRKGYKFSTYATWWIRQAISRAVSDKSRVVRIPAHVSDKLAKVSKFERAFMRDNYREPNTTEIAEALDLSIDEVKNLKRVGMPPASLDKQINVNGDDDNEFSTYFVDNNTPPTEDIVHVNMQNDSLDSLLDLLPYRERKILEYRFGLYGKEVRTLEDIGRAMNITRERVRQLEKMSLERLSNVVGIDALREFA